MRKTLLFILAAGLLLLNGCSLLQVTVYKHSNVTKSVTKTTNGVEALNIGE